MLWSYPAVPALVLCSNIPKHPTVPDPPLPPAPAHPSTTTTTTLLTPPTPLHAHTRLPAAATTAALRTDTIRLTSTGSTHPTPHLHARTHPPFQPHPTLHSTPTPHPHHTHATALSVPVCCCCCSNGRIDREELKVLLESVEGGLAYPLMLTEVGVVVRVGVGVGGGQGCCWGLGGGRGGEWRGGGAQGVCERVLLESVEAGGAGLPTHAHRGA
jgi:hypothetical protein